MAYINRNICVRIPVATINKVMRLGSLKRREAEHAILRALLDTTVECCGLAWSEEQGCLVPDDGPESDGRIAIEPVLVSGG